MRVKLAIALDVAMSPLRCVVRISTIKPGAQLLPWDTFDADMPWNAVPMIARMVEGQDLRGLMRFVPHPVAVLAVVHDRDRMGVTISSLVSLSLDPPLVGISIGKQASIYGILRAAGTFTASILGDGQEDLARRFAAGHPPLIH